MKSTAEHTRQMLGCGFAPQPAANLLPLRTIPQPCGLKDPQSVCPGYTTSLPEVIEVARARLHWSKGGPIGIGVADWQGHPITIGIEILEGSSNEADRWSFDNPVKR